MSTSTTTAAKVQPVATTTTATVPPAAPPARLPSFLVWYHGGLVVHDPHVALVVWGAGYPTATRIAVEHFLGGLHDSPYGAVLGEYLDTHGTINNDIAYAGTWVDTETPAAAPTVEQVQAEAARAVSRAHWTVTPNTVIVVLLPAGVGAEPRSPNSCGFHTAAPAGYLRQTAPAIAVVGYPSGACDFGIGDVGGTTLIASHELAEAVTSPFNAGFAGPSGWWDIGGPPLGEAADACEPAASNMTLSDGGTAVVSDIYGLHEGRCVSFGPTVN